MKTELGSCNLCQDRFAKTHTRHGPRPVIWFSPNARILIAGQAPGARVHTSGKPFTDPSGDRLRGWLGLSEAEFYDQDKIAIVPMAFCFPGYDARGSDLPPPPICSETWRARVLHHIGDVSLTLLIGRYAQSWHLGGKVPVTERVANWRETWPQALPLPHPSWRNTGWLKRNPWFEADVVPRLRRRVREVLDGNDRT